MNCPQMDDIFKWQATATKLSDGIASVLWGRACSHLSSGLGSTVTKPVNHQRAGGSFCHLGFVDNSSPGLQHTDAPPTQPDVHKACKVRVFELHFGNKINTVPTEKMTVKLLRNICIVTSIFTKSFLPVFLSETIFISFPDETSKNSALGHQNGPSFTSAEKECDQKKRLQNKRSAVRRRR